MAERAKTYDPNATEARSTQRWLDERAFDANPDERPADQRYVVMMPLPNVTGALHLGHAMDNVMQDLLIRWHRMRGHNTLWQPGTDHAGIATQAVVEKRLKEFENKTRHDVGREGLVERIWAWKDEYQARIIRQQQAMGCSCDWRRQRFTMDAVCSAAVRETFFKLFCDRLIFRGDRLVNWDCHLQTAVANDEVYHAKVQGHFWHLRYPILDPQPGEPEHVIVATTRPETMLGDTAVACHPDPEAALKKSIAKAQAKLDEASEKEQPAAEAELKRITARLESHLPGLIQLRDMANAGRKVTLPLLGREIPLITDTWAKPELGSGCVKITPAHDPNDYDVWTRHKDAIDSINILNTDGTLNDNAGAYAGDDRFAARKRVVKDLDAQGLLEKTETREVEVGHSDRSKTPIEPFLSKQWFVRMEDVEGGIECGRGTDQAFTAPGLAQAAIDVANGKPSPSGKLVDFHPAGDYRNGYTNWLGEKRDWCISRQLWWGHRIPVWWKRYDDAAALAEAVAKLPSEPGRLHAWISDADDTQHDLTAGLEFVTSNPGNGPWELQVCLRAEADEPTHTAALDALGLERDPDVLDTWFSSALWPFSTLGWPDPAKAPINPGERDLSDALDYYYPGSCLVTGRDILTLWVARMVIMGLYNLGEVPFTDVFLHCKIMDGNGLTMSKSKGNGVDPTDIIARYGADALRYVICDMQTGSQDARLPVQADCPTCKKEVELANAKHGRTMFSYLCTHCKAEFDMLGTLKDAGVPQTDARAERFEEGKKFCNKLWNAAGFALPNLAKLSFQPLTTEQLAPEDRWILSRLANAIQTVDAQLEAYNPSAALSAARGFFWSELCDWYLELIKPRMSDATQGPIARQVLATVLDQVLRLLHPFLPFITEGIFEELHAQAPQRGIEAPLPTSTLCALAVWPTADTARADAALEAEFELLRDALRGIRDMRTKYNVPPKNKLPCAIKASGSDLATLKSVATHIENLGRLASLTIAPEADRPANSATAVVGEVEIFLGDVLDPEKERARLAKQQEKLQKQIGGVEKKLSNEKFTAKAPATVVESERERLAGLQRELALVEENLAAL